MAYYSPLTLSSQLPPIRRVVTGHTQDGTAVTLEDRARSPRGSMRDPAFFSDVLFWTDSVPCDNPAGPFMDFSRQHIHNMSPTGSMLRVIDFAPGCKTLFHRTLTLDYCIVTCGAITLVLDNDRHVKLKAGDVIIQRGTIHAWINEGEEWARAYFVLLAANKVKVGKTELQADYRHL